MTNAEKYLKDGVDIKQMATEMVNYFNFPPYEGIGESSIEEFFGKEVKPTLTEDERVILRNARTWGNEKFRYIMRTAYGLRVTANAFHFSENEPEEEGFDLCAFNHLFQFIKERRRILYRGVAKMNVLEKIEYIHTHFPAYETKYYLGFGFGTHRKWVNVSKKTYFNKFLSRFAWHQIEIKPVTEEELLKGE